MRCSQCPFFAGEVPEDACARCSRSLRPATVLAAAALVLGYGLLCRGLHYLLDGSFYHLLPAHRLSLPADYVFPVNLSVHPEYGVVLGLLYGLVVGLPALAATVMGFWVGASMALLGGLSLPHGWFFIVLLVSAALAGSRLGGPRWWWRRLLLGTGVPMAVLLSAHVASALSAGELVHLLPAAVATVVVVLPACLWRREVRWRSLRWQPVLVVALVLGLAAPLLFSFTVTFPYHRYRLLWGRWSTAGGSAGEASPFERSLAAALRDPGPGAQDPTDACERIRGQAAGAFADFAQRHPGSPYAPEALCQQAVLLNLTCTVDADGRARVHQVRISPEALLIYTRIIDRYSDSVAAVRARLEQARRSYEQTRFEEARQHYRDILTTYESHVPPDYQPPADLLLAGVTARAGSGRQFTGEERQVAYYEAYLSARQALVFLQGNGQFEAEPLRLFVGLDARADDYRDRLKELLLLYPEDVYPDLGLHDDVHLVLARGQPDEDQRLEALLARYPAGDARDRALYRLAELAFQRGQPGEGVRYLRSLAEGVPAGPEGAWARALLSEGLADRAGWPRPSP